MRPRHIDVEDRGGGQTVHTCRGVSARTQRDPRSQRTLDGGFVIVILAPYEDSRITEGDVSNRIREQITDRKSTRLNSSHVAISYAVFCLKKKKKKRAKNKR